MGVVEVQLLCCAHESCLYSGYASRGAWVLQCTRLDCTRSSFGGSRSSSVVVLCARKLFVLKDFNNTIGRWIDR